MEINLLITFFFVLSSYNMNCLSFWFGNLLIWWHWHEHSWFWLLNYCNQSWVAFLLAIIIIIMIDFLNTLLDWSFIVCRLYSYNNNNHIFISNIIIVVFFDYTTYNVIIVDIHTYVWTFAFLIIIIISLMVFFNNHSYIHLIMEVNNNDDYMFY